MKNSFKKVLGLLWNVKSDTLKLPSNIKRISNTKRGLLSALCSVFEPLGFVVCLIEPKLIIQELWQRNIEWDQALSTEGRANKWINSVKYLKEIKFPDTTELTCQLKNLSYTFLMTHRQRIMVVLLTLELSKTIKQRFHL